MTGLKMIGLCNCPITGVRLQPTVRLQLCRLSNAKYAYIIDQALGQDGWILAEFSFCIFMDRDEVEVHKNVKRERGQYPAILTELAWSMNDLRTCLFLSTEKQPS